MAQNALTVVTNNFEVTRLPQKTYYHYDVFSPESSLKRRNFGLINTLQTKTESARFQPPGLYDGRKNYFSTLPGLSGTYAIPTGRGGREIVVKLQKVSAIDTSVFQSILKRDASAGSRAESQLVVSLIQLIVLQAPNEQHSFPADARAFYVQYGAQDLRGGLLAWRGYSQSIRPTSGRLLLNIDVTHAAVYAPGPLENLILTYLAFGNRNQLANLDNSQVAKLNMFLKGVLVQHEGSPRGHPKPIRKVIPDCGSFVFERNDMACTVKDYFLDKYNLPIQPNTLGVVIGRGDVIPAARCRVTPGQVYKKKLQPEQQATLLKFATQRPDARMDGIRQALQGQPSVLTLADAPQVQESGMQIRLQPIEIRGKVMRPPSLMYGGTRGRLDVREREGRWNMVNQKFYKPKQIQKWSVVVLDPRARQDLVNSFVRMLTRNLGNLGMSAPQPYFVAGNPMNAFDALEGSAAKGKPEFVLVILPRQAEECRDTVKRWSIHKRHIPVQCVRDGKYKDNDQYCNNVALKINTRLGGVNAILAPDMGNPLVKDLGNVIGTCMVVGADVSHPPPGSEDRFSVAGIVSSTVGSTFAKYSSNVRIQRQRQEIIEDLADMFAVALLDFGRDDGGAVAAPPPQFVIFYRDGVSDGEYDQVLQQEYAKLQEGLRKAKAWLNENKKHANWNPSDVKIALIVVTKRHHVRFAPKNPREGDNKSGNCPAGFLVDTELTHPKYEDYFLLSHSGLLGTSRPAHYIVIKNEIPRIRVEHLQLLSFYLCHVYSNATRSVSIPAPVYYADRLVGCGDIHFEKGLDRIEPPPRGVDVLDHYSPLFKTNFKMRSTMYFI